MAFVGYNDPLIRNGWIKDAIKLHSKSESRWSKYNGKANSVIHRINDISRGDIGHNVLFQTTGYLTAKAIHGKQQVYGKGEDKRVFSTSVTVDRWWHTVSNGDIFEGIDINQTDLNMHSNSVAELGDKVVRWTDQAFYDLAQGNIVTTRGGIDNKTDNKPSHLFRFPMVKDNKGFADESKTAIDTAIPSNNFKSSLTYNNLVKLEQALTVSRRFAVGGIRRPMMTTRGMMDMSKKYILMLDSRALLELKLDPRWQDIQINAMDRGMQNPMFRNIVAGIGKLMISQEDTFFGVTDNDTIATEADLTMDGVANTDKHIFVPSQFYAWNDSNKLDVRGVRSFKAGVDTTAVLKTNQLIHANYGRWSMGDSEIEIPGLRTFDYNGHWLGQPSYKEDGELWTRGCIIAGNAFQSAWGKEPTYKTQDSQDYAKTSESACQAWWNAQRTVYYGKTPGLEDYRVAKVANIDNGIINIDVQVQASTLDAAKLAALIGDNKNTARPYWR